MIALLVVALLDLRLAASLDGMRVRATLRNEGAATVEVVAADACAGSRLRLVIDNYARPFSTTGKRCPVAQPIKTLLAPGAELSLLSDSLDGKLHHLVVEYETLRSPMIVAATVVRVDVKLTATAHARAGAPVDLEIVHLNRSPEDVVIASCGEDRLVVDGQEGPLPNPPECNPEARTIARNGAIVSRGVIKLATGRHVLRARWHGAQSDDITVDVAE